LKPELIFRQRPQNAEVAYVKKTIVIPSTTRSADVNQDQPIILERQPQELTIQLPVGSDRGAYEFQLKGKDRTIISTGGNAEIDSGITAFTVKLDLSGLRPGNYAIQVRQVPFEWNLYPVVAR